MSDEEGLCRLHNHDALSSLPIKVYKSMFPVQRAPPAPQRTGLKKGVWLTLRP
jgi:hypothetical protein